MKRKLGDIVVTIFGWAGVIDKIYDSKNGKQKYRVIDEDCHPSYRFRKCHCGIRRNRNAVSGKTGVGTALEPVPS